MREGKQKIKKRGSKKQFWLLLNVMMLGEDITKPALISSDLSTEWKNFRRYISQQPKEDMKAQLKELTSMTCL